MYALLHKRRAQSVSIQQNSSSGNREKRSERAWEDIQAGLKQDLAYLRTLAGSQEKNPYKQTLIDKYRPTVESLLTTHNTLGGLDIVWWFYQWQIDLGRFEQIQADFRQAIDNGLETPASWKSNGQTAYCDTVFTYSFEADRDEKKCEKQYLTDTVTDLQEGKLATNAPLKVKMFRLLGDWYLKAEDQEKAYALYQQVMQLDPSKGGRKTRLKELAETLGYDQSHQE